MVCIVVLIAAWGAVVPPAEVHAQDDVSWLLGQINNLRAGLGLHLYSLNPQLSAAATQHSHYMVDTCDVSHTEANGSTATTRARANGYTGDWISENIYMGTNARAVDAWNFWLNSGIHYQGMTHHIVNEIGIGVAYGACGQGFTLVFGHRADVTAPPAPPAPPPDAGNDPPPPTAPRYVPPPPTLTPTPTMPTLTPSHTWTITPTHTPSVTHTPTLPAIVVVTATPLILPTVPALDDLATATVIMVAQVPTVTPPPALLPPSATPATTPPDRDSGDADDDSDRRTLLFVLLLGGAVLLGGVGIAILWRVRM